MDRFPGGVVADGDGGVQDQPVAPSYLQAEVLDVAVKDSIIGDGDDLIFPGFYPGDVEFAVQHDAGDLSDFNDVPGPERTLVGQGHPGDEVGDGRR